MSDSAFQSAKAYLMKCEHNGESVYGHLFALLQKVMEENPNNVAQHPDKFLQQLSAMMRSTRFVHGDAPTSHRDEISPDPRSVERSNVSLDLFKQPQPDVVTTVLKPRPGVTVTTTTVVPKPCPKFQSLLNNSMFWRLCGVGLPENEVFLLEQSITRHAMEKKLEEVNFIGRLNGTQSNYYAIVSKRVVPKDEKVYEEVNSMPLPPRKGVEVDMQAEPAWKGLNRYTFWVCSYAGDSWKALPDLTPQQLNAARSIKKFFTGNLDADVVSYPPFPWKENVYLRAQLARIWSSTIVSPQGAMVQPEPPEADPEPELEEGAPIPLKEAKYLGLTEASKEWAPPEEGVVGLNNLEMWVHHTQHIFKMGRATKVPDRVVPDDAEPEEPEEEVKAEEEKELFQPLKSDRLLGIINIPKIPTEEDEAAEEEEPKEEPEEGEGEEKEEEEIDEDALLADDGEDDPLKYKIRPWSIATNNTFYKKHGVVVLRSHRWPGAYAYAGNGGKNWGCVYFGDGIKRTHNNFAPTPAPKLQKEAEDIIEFVDPTAANEKLVLRGEEPKANDSEDEKEEDENEEEQE